jgi:hypothetical protein
MRQVHGTGDCALDGGEDTLAGVVEPDGLQAPVGVEERQHREAAQHLAGALEDAARADDRGGLTMVSVGAVKSFSSSNLVLP